MAGGSLPTIGCSTIDAASVDCRGQRRISALCTGLRSGARNLCRYPPQMVHGPTVQRRQGRVLHQQSPRQAVRRFLRFWWSRDRRNKFIWPKCIWHLGRTALAACGEPTAAILRTAGATMQCTEYLSLETLLVPAAWTVSNYHTGQRCLNKWKLTRRSWQPLMIARKVQSRHSWHGPT